MSILAVLAGLAPALVALLSLSGLISAAETSMTAASRARMHQLEREGDRAARRINQMMADQEKMIGAILLSVISNILNLTSIISVYLNAAVQGFVIIVVAFLQRGRR